VPADIIWGCLQAALHVLQAPHAIGTDIRNGRLSSDLAASREAWEPGSPSRSRNRLGAGASWAKWNSRTLQNQSGPAANRVFFFINFKYRDSSQRNSMKTPVKWKSWAADGRRQRLP